MSNNTVSSATFEVQIADRSGHNVIGNLDVVAAIEAIIEHSVVNARFAYINGQLFTFEGTDHRSPENVARLNAALTKEANPLIMLTGLLQGGQE